MVQFRAASGQATEDGRVEHLVSGLAARFETWAELRDFVEHVLGRSHVAAGEMHSHDGEIAIDEGG